MRTLRASRFSKGVTLVEVLFTFVTVAIAGVWLLQAYHSAIRMAEASQQEGVAIDHLKAMLERIQATPFSQLTTSFPSGAAGNYSAIVGGYALPTTQGSNEQIFVTHVPDTNAETRELRVEVRWTNAGRVFRKTMAIVRANRAS